MFIHLYFVIVYVPLMFPPHRQRQQQHVALIFVNMRISTKVSCLHLSCGLDSLYFINASIFYLDKVHSYNGIFSANKNAFPPLQSTIYVMDRYRFTDYGFQKRQTKLSKAPFRRVNIHSTTIHHHIRICLHTNHPLFSNFPPPLHRPLPQFPSLRVPLSDFRLERSAIQRHVRRISLRKTHR